MKTSNLYLQLWIATAWLSSLHAASFYGSNFASVPFNEAQSNTELSFRIKTTRSEALILLAAGRTDYLLVMMQAGFIKVHINLGVGETELESSKIRLDDLNWHEIKITRDQDKIELIIDRQHTSSASLPGQYYELNIHYGVFVGGMGNFSELFLGNQENFRGCMDDIIFNDRNILQQAKHNGSTIGVTWDCSDEFEANSVQSISFLSEKAFISFPNWISSSGFFLKLKVKTSSKYAILFYTAGLYSTSSFIRMDLENGRIRLIIKQGDVFITIINEVSINDGLWHELKAFFSLSLLEITVDQSEMSKRYKMNSKKHFDSFGSLYVGGIESFRLQKELNQEISNATGSLMGCLSQIELDGKKIGLPEVISSESIKVGCNWQYPCLKMPCNFGESCTQESIFGFKCECQNITNCTSESTFREQVWFETSKLYVVEGKQALITSNHLKLAQNISIFGVNERDLVFSLFQPPFYGRLLQLSDPNRKVESFTLADVISGKISYLHIEGEKSNDTIIFDVSLNFPAKNMEKIPLQLKNPQKYTLEVIVEPLNIVPKIVLDPELNKKPLRIFEGTKMHLNEKMIHVIDPDNTKEEIIITLLPTLNQSIPGYIENERFPNQARNSFSYNDLTLGKVKFVYQDSNVKTLSLRVSDRQDDGNTVFLTLDTYKLEIFIVNNTGILLPKGTATVISSENLTVTTNSYNDGIILRFDIEDPPRFGRLEKLRDYSKWTSTRRFNGKQLENGKVRYVHLDKRSNVSFDTFKFTVSALYNNYSNSGPILSSIQDTFKIEILSNNLKQVRKNSLNLLNVKEMVITDLYLMYQTFPKYSDDSQIIYKIKHAPKNGILMLSSSGIGSFGSEIKMRTGSSFCQTDLLAGHLRYKLTSYNTKTSLKDNFTFEVSLNSIESLKSQSYSVQALDDQFFIYYSPGDTTVDIKLERLEVEEGSRRTLTRKHLSIESPDIEHYVFNVTRCPSYGRIIVLAPNKVEDVRANATFFSSDEIETDRVVYEHDDSESRRDSFHFVATASRKGQDFRYEGVFHVHVTLKNDHAPTQAVIKVFDVVENGHKLLTGDILRFVDNDIDTLPRDIKYSHHALPNGELVFVDSPKKPVFEFTQADLDERRIIFKHFGSAFGRIMLWVTDGQYYASTELKVRAGPPFLRVAKNTGLIVQRADSAFLSTANLTLTTNLNACSNDIKFIVKSPPKNGKILKNDIPVTYFTAQDIEDEMIEYRNNNSLDPNELLRLKVIAEDNAGYQATIEIDFKIHIYPEVYWEPLAIASNNSILVEESTSIAITKHNLQVERKAEMAATDVIFMVKRPPLYGYLEIDPPLTSPQSEVTLFDQATINEGRLHYIQSVSNQSSDAFVFDVTNGISSLENLIFHLSILPKHLYIEPRDLWVTEGQESTLSSTNIYVLTDYFADKIKDYLIVDPPSAGRLVDVSEASPNSAVSPSVTIFSVEDLHRHRIRYFHDGGDQPIDQLTLVASTGEKTSMPATLTIRVLPVDDEPPILVNNTGLEVWAGATATITNRHLGAIDADTDSANITFFLLDDPGPSSPIGAFTLLEQKATSFSQKDLAQEKVLFSHKGQRRSGSIPFQLTDGLNKGGNGMTYFFNIRVKDVSIHLERHDSLDVFPMTEVALRVENLLVATSDKGSERQISFWVKKPPRMGRLLLRDRLREKEYFLSVHNFTQADVNAGRVAYKHTQPFSNLTAFDEVVLEARTEHAQRSLDLVLNVRISVTAMIPGGGIDRFIGAEGLRVDEGGMVALAPRNLNTSGILEFIRSHRQQGEHPGDARLQQPQLRLQVSALPRHGAVYIGQEVAALGQAFTQSDVDRGIVSYLHDHSDTTSDTLGVAVFLEGEKSETFGDGKGRSGDILLFDGVWNVTVDPVNDRPFRLVTDTPGMTVVQYQSRSLSQSLLFTQDADTPDSQLIYDVVTPPAFGRLVSADNLSAPLLRFSQREVNDHKVVYVHDEGGPTTDFYFRVSDGQFQPVYRHFRIHVLPLEVKLVNVSAIPIQQGTRMAYISSSHLGAVTNGQRALTFYNITRPPVGGLIYMNDAPASIFGQVNVDNEEVVYMQTDMSLANDSFVATLSSQTALLEDVAFQIKVEPLVRCREAFRVTEAKVPTPLGQAHLDASQLAGLTNSNPVFFLAQKPKYGRIMRIVRASKAKRSVRDKEVWQFTHEEVKNEVIFFVMADEDAVELVHGPANDSFVYRLEAPGVQPAYGKFDFVVLVNQEGSKTRSNPVTEDVATYDDEGRDGAELLVAIGALFLAILVLTAVILAIRLRRASKKRSKCTAPSNVDTAVGGNPYGALQRPLRRNINNGFASLEQHPHSNTLRSLPKPDAVNEEETDPDSWSYSRETSPESIPPGMPAFRVIPLAANCDNEMDHFCPEATSDWDPLEQARCGSAQPPTTLLRKNQYWV